MGAETGAVHGAGLPHLATLSASDSAFHRWPKTLSLSALRRDAGSKGRCARQNVTYPEWGMKLDSAFAGAPPETTAAARDPTDVACSECEAEVVGAADGSAVEGLPAVVTMPLYAKPVLGAAGRAAQQRDTPRTISCSTNSTAILQNRVVG